MAMMTHDRDVSLIPTDDDSSGPDPDMPALALSSDTDDSEPMDPVQTIPEPESHHTPYNWFLEGKYEPENEAEPILHAETGTQTVQATLDQYTQTMFEDTPGAKLTAMNAVVSVSSSSSSSAVPGGKHKSRKARRSVARHKAEEADALRGMRTHSDDESSSTIVELRPI